MGPSSRRIRILTWAVFGAIGFLSSASSAPPAYAAEPGTKHETAERASQQGSSDAERTRDLERRIEELERRYEMEYREPEPRPSPTAEYR